jgi:uncharacterized membrane protein
MMVEIAVDLMSIHNTAQNVYALKVEEGAVVEFQHLLKLQLAKAAIRDGLLMVFVMISTTIYSAPTMVEIAVDLMSIHNTAQNVYALKVEEGVVVEIHYLLELHLAEAAFRFGLEMAIAMISTTI